MPQIQVASLEKHLQNEGAQTLGHLQSLETLQHQPDKVLSNPVCVAPALSEVRPKSLGV